MTAPEILHLIAWVLRILLGLCYAYQIVYLFLPLFRKKVLPDTRELRRYAILIAARNEEAVLPHLLESIHSQDYPRELVQVFVVADNCTDSTALVARQGGAEVFIRHNTHQVGKGYALNFLLEQIGQTWGWDRFDAFLVFDADNVLQPDYITQINKVCCAGYDVFCGYRNSKNFGTNWVSAGHSLWFLHDSTHLNASRMALGNPCTVTGTGFGFTRRIVEKYCGWNFFTLTEDIEFSFRCISDGVKMGYCQDAILYDEQPETFRQSWRQRTRWVQGGLQVSVRYGKALLKGIFRGGRTSRACLEAMTLSLWGYSAGILCGILSFTAAGLRSGWAGIGQALLFAFLGAYCFAFLMGAMTLFMARRRIRASASQKLMGLFTFPLYPLTYAPIAVTALFRKFHWPPIEHTVSLSAEELMK